MQRIAVLHVSGMPRACRPRVEQAMLDVITSEPGADVLDATWCTRWQRSGVAAGAVDCRQVLSGTDEELDIFSGVMSLMAGEHGFQAYVELVG